MNEGVNAALGKITSIFRATYYIYPVSGRNLTLSRAWNPVFWILLVLSTIPLRIAAQPNRYGIFMLTHYSQEVTGSSGLNRSITQDGRGILYVGNDGQGILEYDGMRWRSIPVPGGPAIQTMVTGEDGVVYVGTDAEFGCLLPDRTGRMVYHSLADSLKGEYPPVSGKVKPFKINGKIFFCSPMAICIYDPATRKMNILNTPDRVSNFFQVDSLLYLISEQEGLMKLDGKVFGTFPGGRALTEMAVSGILRIDRNRLLVATRSNGLLLYDTEAGSLDESFADPLIDQHLEDGIISQLRKWGSGFVVGTINRGLVLFDREGNALQVITREEGLPDQSINCLYSRQPEDGTGPLWIVHDRGISKLEINTPITVFTENAGFEGEINDIIFFSNRLFLATTNGLYYRSSTALTTRFLPIPELEGERILQLHRFTPSRWGSLLMASSEENTWLIEPSLRLRPLNETIRIPDQDSARPETYTGGYLVQDPHRSNTMYTGQQQIVGLEYFRRRWSEVLHTELSQPLSGKMEIDRYGFLWATSPQEVIRMDISRLTHVKTRTYSAGQGLPNRDHYLVFLDPDRQTLLLGTGDGFYRFDYFNDRFYRDTLLNPMLPSGMNRIRFFYRDPEKGLWISLKNEFSGWSDVVIRQQPETRGEMQEKLFRRLPDLPTRIYYPDPEKGVWIGKSERLYHTDNAIVQVQTIPFNALIRKVSLNQDSLLFQGATYRPDQKGVYRLTGEQCETEVPKIGYRYGNITFEWAAACFVAEDQLKFSVKLTGLDQQWSEWNKDAGKTYTDLASGTYIFHVRAMNVYGEISKAATYSFRIRRPWFGSFPALLSYFLLIVGAITLIIRRRTRQP